MTIAASIVHVVILTHRTIAASIVHVVILTRRVRISVVRLATLESGI